MEAQYLPKEKKALDSFLDQCFKAGGCKKPVIKQSNKIKKEPKASVIKKANRFIT